MDTFSEGSSEGPSEDCSNLYSRAGSNGKWSFDPTWLYTSLVNGDVRLSDDFLQMIFLDYIEKQ